MAFRAAIPFISPAVDSEAFSDLGWIPLLLSSWSLPSYGRSLELLCLLSVLLSTRQVAGSLCRFPAGGTQTTSVISPLPADPGLPSACAPHLPELAQPTVCTGSPLQSARSCGAAWGSLGEWGSVGGISPASRGQASWVQNAVSRESRTPLSICSFLHHGSPSSVFWMLQERNESLWQHPAQLREPGVHSLALPFPHGRNHRPSSLALSCAALGVGWCQQR